MLKDTEYAYAVSRIRANETSLLKKSDIDQLISAADNTELFRILSDKGWKSAENTIDISEVLKDEANKCWELICDAVPDKNEFDFLIIENDFHNLKACIKALVAGTDPKEMFAYPALTNPEVINEAVKSKKYGSLPDYLKETATEGYSLITRTSDGQLTDIYIDRKALEAQYNMAVETDCKMFIKIAAARVNNAAYKTGLRCALTGKDESFIHKAVANCNTFDEASLSKSASRGIDEYLNYIENVMGSTAAETAKNSVSEFEKLCDDIITNEVSEAKLISLGPQPIVAFYFAREAEIKTVRIIASCKENGVDSESIVKRVRALYV